MYTRNSYQDTALIFRMQYMKANYICARERHQAVTRMDNSMIDMRALTEMAVIQELVIEMANMFAEDNERFMRQYFYEACGMKIQTDGKYLMRVDLLTVANDTVAKELGWI